VIQIPVLCSLLLLSRLAPRVGAACNRSIHLDGYVTSEYPANNPIEDRHAVVEASGKCTVICSHNLRRLPPHTMSMIAVSCSASELHAIVLDGHGKHYIYVGRQRPILQ
jgi:hypothetical protein